MQSLSELIVGAAADSVFEKVSTRNELFYKKFKYSVSFSIPFARALSLRNMPAYMNNYFKAFGCGPSIHIKSIINAMELWEKP